MLLKKILNYLPFCILGLCAVTIFILLSDDPARKLYWGGDYAIFLIDMYHASGFDQRVGIASRFGWAHPGPLNYYLLFPWFVLSNGGDQSLIIGTFSLNVAFLLLSIYIIKKIATRELSVAFSVILICYVTIALGPRVFFDVLIPFSTILPWCLAVCLSCAVILHGFRYIIFLISILCYVSQMHIAFWVPAMALGVSTVIFSSIYRWPTHREIYYLIGGFLIFIILWLPPFLEFENIISIFEFFASRPIGEHSFIDAFLALASLIGQPLVGYKLDYSSAKFEEWAFLAGTVLLAASPLITWIAYLKKNHFAVVLGLVIIIQIITYVFSLTKVVGPILHHSITFFPIIGAFILVQLVSVAFGDKANFSNIINIMAICGILALLIHSSHTMLKAIDIAKTPDSAVENLYQTLAKNLDFCGDNATVIIEQEVWPLAVGAISAAYRSGRKFTINPLNWSIIFGWRVPVRTTECQIEFTSHLGVPVIVVNDYRDSGKFEIGPILSLSGLNFSKFGLAKFEEDQNLVESDSYVDAGFVSNEIFLAAGLYKIDAFMDWDVTSENLRTNGGHLSLHGERILIPIRTSKKTNEHISIYFHADGNPIKLSFGLGGWSKGKGFVRLARLNVSTVKQIAE